MAQAKIWITYQAGREASERTGDPYTAANLTKRIVEESVNPLLTDTLDVEVVKWPLFPDTEKLVKDPDNIRAGGVLWHFFTAAMNGEIDYVDHANIVLTAQESRTDISGRRVVGLGSKMGFAFSGMGGILADATEADIGSIRADKAGLAAQVIIHELGHMVEMTHEEGHARMWEDTPWVYVSSPMVSGYFSSDIGGFRGSVNRCGEQNATVDDASPAFGWELAYTECEKEDTQLHARETEEDMNRALTNPDEAFADVCFMRPPETWD